MLVHPAPCLSGAFPQCSWFGTVLCMTLLSWPVRAVPRKSIWPITEHHFPSFGISWGRQSCLFSMVETVIITSTLGHLCGQISLQMAWRTGGGQCPQGDRGSRGSETAEKRILAVSKCLGLTFPWPSLTPVPGLCHRLLHSCTVGLLPNEIQKSAHRARPLTHFLDCSWFCWNATVPLSTTVKVTGAQTESFPPLATNLEV